MEKQDRAAIKPFWQRFLSFFQNGFFRDAHNRYPLLGSMLINSIMWVAILIKIHAENKPIPLHFNAFYGIEQVGPGFLFLGIPLTGAILGGLNLALARYAYRTEKYLGNLICYGTLAVQISLLIATLAIIILNS